MNEAIKERFHELSIEEKQRIYHQIWLLSDKPPMTGFKRKREEFENPPLQIWPTSMWIEQHLFADPKLFFRAVLNAGLEHYLSFSRDSKLQVYVALALLKGQTVNHRTLKQWGEKIALENLPLLFDAIFHIFNH
jgi:hypothetical protein